MADRTGCPVLYKVWSHVIDSEKIEFIFLRAPYSVRWTAVAVGGIPYQVTSYRTLPYRATRAYISSSISRVAHDSHHVQLHTGHPSGRIHPRHPTPVQFIHVISAKYEWTSVLCPTQFLSTHVRTYECTVRGIHLLSSYLLTRTYSATSAWRCQPYPTVHPSHTSLASHTGLAGHTSFASFASPATAEESCSAPRQEK